MLLELLFTMKFTIVTLLVVSAYAQGRSIEPEGALTSAYGYLEKSVIYAEARRKAEEEYVNNQRIIGGSAAVLEQFPYQVSKCYTYVITLL